MKGFLKGDRSLMHRLLKDAEVNIFHRFLILFVVAFGSPFVWILAAEPFHDSASGFQNPFQPVGLELESTSCCQ
jgi:hypothetical protein